MTHRRTQLKKVPPLPRRGDRLARLGVGYYSSRYDPPNTRCVAAFTLLEVILAVTIAGALLAGAATLMVSVTNAWLEREDRHFFEDHVDGVTQFLQASFSMAGTEIALSDDDESSASTSNESDNKDTETGSPQVTVEISGNNASNSGNSSESKNSGSTTGSGLIRVSEDPIDWSKPPGFADHQDPLLHFGLRSPRHCSCKQKMLPSSAWKPSSILKATRASACSGIRHCKKNPKILMTCAALRSVSSSRRWNMSTGTKVSKNGKTKPNPKRAKATIHSYSHAF